jgi:hypothetical protein
MKSRAPLFILFSPLIIFIFRSWFTTGVTLSAGDWLYAFPQSFSHTFLYPYIWYPLSLTKLGENNVLQLPLTTYYLGTGYLFTDVFHLSWIEIERVLWFFPFLILSFFSSRYLFAFFFSDLDEKYSLICSLIFMTNTYVLMMVGGGQISVGIAYSLVPFVFVQFAKLVNAYTYKPFRLALIVGLLFSLLVFFDLRFAYISLIPVLLFILFSIPEIVQKKYVFKNLFLFILFLFIPFGITLFLHAFWILPLVLSHQNPAEQLGAAYTSLSSVQYFSFAKFENTISLLHPYWPENIFGKVSFMKPEFLILPIVAFSSLLFVNKKNKKESQYILFFALLGLIGAFLAKGTNDPFGNVYLWIFGHVPGFVMFRDPTKWYMLIVLSYSVLIPFTIWKASGWLSEKSKKKIKNVISHSLCILFVIIWFVTIRQAFFGQLTGTFSPTIVPSEYISFEEFLSNQQQFSRTFWIPSTQRFGYFSQNHPAISAEYFFNIFDEKSLIRKLNQPGTEKLLQESGVKYVVVPTDSQKEIFLNDRTYSQKLYLQTIKDVSKIPWLKPVHVSNLAIFELSNFKNHFWISTNAKISFQTISPVEYKVSVTNAKKGDRLIFSESFDPNWVLTTSKYYVSSSKYDSLNSFILPQNGSYTMDVYYTSQKWVDRGVWISLGALIIIVGSLFILKI